MTSQIDLPPPLELHPAWVLPHTRFSRLADRITRRVSELVHWAWAALAIVIFFNVLLRYVLHTNFVWAEELQWHIYGFGIMIAIAYGITEDAHVRVDVLAQSFSPRKRAIIELLGFTLFLVPLFTLLLIYAWPFVANAWVRNEASSSPGGLPSRWIIKSVLLLAFGLLLLVSLGRISRVIAFLRRQPEVK